MDRPLSIHENASTADAIQLLDETIKRHQAYIQILKKQRNNFMSISRLPMEILCIIFSIVKMESSIDARHPKEWLKLTHVSHHWRNVAMASPTLWTGIDTPVLLKHSLLEAVLGRSNGDLSIDINTFISSHIISGLGVVLNHSERIRRISVLVSPREWPDLWSRFRIWAPRLELLSLTSQPRGQRAIFGLEDVVSQFPKLRHLELNNFEVNWSLLSSFKFHALTFLQLSDTHSTWTQFADALRAMPNLQFLALENALPRGPVPPYPTRVSLASLHTLRVRFAPAQNIRNLLRSCIAIPSTANIFIGSYDYCYLDLLRNNIDGLFSEPTPLSPDAPHFQTIILLESSLKETSFRDTGIRMKLYVDALRDEQILAHGMNVPRLELDLAWTTNSYSASTTQNVSEMDIITADIFCALSLQDVKRLYLESIPTSLSTTVFAKTFGMLPQLSYVMAASWCGMFIDALKLDFHTFEGRGSTVYFPALSSIYLYGYFYSHLPAVRISKLFDCLQQRCRIGAKIERLRFKTYPNLGEADLDKLQAFVLKPIEWD